MSKERPDVIGSVGPSQPADSSPPLPRQYALGELHGLPKSDAGGTWEIGIVEIPAPEHVGSGVGHVAVCVSENGAGMSLPSRDRLADDAAFQAMASHAMNPPAPGVPGVGYLPTIVRISKMPASMQMHFARCTKSLGIRTEFATVLPRLRDFEEMINDMAEDESSIDENDDDGGKALMVQPGMTVERVAAFADAANAFFRARPWKLQNQEVLWKIDPAPSEPGMGYVTIMGAGGEEFGLGFIPSVQAFELMNAAPMDPKDLVSSMDTPLWSVMFDTIETMHVEDGALWEHHGFNTAGKNAFPTMVGTTLTTPTEEEEPDFRALRPSGEMLTFTEGLLRAVALLSRADVATGRFTATVPTFDGSREYTLTAERNVLQQLAAMMMEPKMPSKNKKKKLSPREAEPSAVLRLKVTLRGSKPPIWRRLLVRDDALLAELHDAIQIAFGWGDEHMHEFKVGKRTFAAAPDEGFPVDSMFGGPEGEDEWTVRLADLKLAAKSTFNYTYDFGDSWEHQVTVEKILTPDEAQKELAKKCPDEYKSGDQIPIAVCPDGARRGPLEDCGGVWRWNNLCEILQDPKHPEYEEYSEWSGIEALNPDGTKNFDPELFELKPVNKKLLKAFKV